MNDKLSQMAKRIEDEVRRQAGGGDVYQWTTTPPTVEGWYWAKDKLGKMRIVRKGWGSGYEMVGSNLSAFKEDFTHFLGPLPIPEPPK